MTRLKQLSLRICLVIAFVGAASSAIAVAPAAMVPAADATCHGAGNPAAIVIKDANGRTRGRETATPRTCDRDGGYIGQVADTFRERTRNLCVLVQFRDGGSVTTDAYDCTPNDGANRYSLHDRSGDRQGYIRVCLEDRCGSAPWRRIWGY